MSLQNLLMRSTFSGVSWCPTWMCTWIRSLYIQSTSKCFSANSLLARSSWRASDLRLLDSMIVCILSVPATLSSFLLPFSLQKMQHISILQLYLQEKTTEDAYFAENIGINFTTESFRFLKSTHQWYTNSKKYFVWTAVHAYWSMPPNYYMFIYIYIYTLNI